MSDFHSIVRSIQAEVWECGPHATAALDDLLSDLARTAPPAGVTRLSSARIAPGPHLAAQPEQVGAVDDLRRRREARRAKRANMPLAMR
jgi:hypothetical protein